jgi:chemotaxis protein histidine kinase CheA
MSDSDDSDYSQNDEDDKMKALLTEWDEKDEEKATANSSDEESDESEEEEVKPKKSKSKSKKEEAKSKKSKSKSKKKKESSSEEESDESEEEEVKPKKGKSKKEEVKKSKSKSKPKKEESSSEEESSDEEEEEVKPKKEKPKSKSKKDDDDSESEEEDESESDSDEEIGDKLMKKPKAKKEPKVKAKRMTDINDDDDEDDIEMKKLMGDWDDENDDDSDDDDDDDDDDDSVESEASERLVILDDNVLDHIVLAAPDLDEAIKEFETKTGLAPVVAGTIKGLGIRCARVSFSDATYLEIIAPDPNGPGPIGELIKKMKLTDAVPFHYAIRTSKAEELKDEVGKFGYTPDHITMFGAKKDGTPKKWEMLYLYGHKLGGICPFFINWSNSDHPCATLPVIGNLKKFTIRAPSDDPIHKLFEHIDVEGVNIESGSAKMSFQFKSAEGTIKYESKKLSGFKFPGFESDVGAIDGDEGEQDEVVVFENPAAPELLQMSDNDYDDE